MYIMNNVRNVHTYEQNNKNEYIINFRQTFNYKKDKFHSNELYRKQFLQTFFLSDFDNNAINAIIDELYENMIASNRITPEFENILNKENMLLGIDTSNEKQNSILKLKLLFSYDTLDVFVPYVCAMLTYSDAHWNDVNHTLLKSLLLKVNKLSI